jgi:hypothetical protein
MQIIKIIKTYELKSEVKIKFKKNNFEGEGKERKREGEERVKER